MKFISKKFRPLNRIIWKFNYRQTNFKYLDFVILNTIKEKSPKSIRYLAAKIDKDVGNIQPKVKKLADDGFIKFEIGPKNSKIPYLTYDEIKLEI